MLSILIHDSPPTTCRGCRTRHGAHLSVGSRSSNSRAPIYLYFWEGRGQSAVKAEPREPWAAARGPKGWGPWKCQEDPQPEVGNEAPCPPKPQPEVPSSGYAVTSPPRHPALTPSLSREQAGIPHTHFIDGGNEASEGALAQGYSAWGWYEPGLRCPNL